MQQFSVQFGLKHRRQVIIFVFINEICIQSPKFITKHSSIVTELGFLTIHLKTVTFNPTHGAFEAKVQLFIDGEEVLKKSSKQTTASFNIDETYKSDKISKDSKVRIEVRAHDAEYSTVLEHQTNVKTLLKDPIYHTARTSPLTVKSIEVEAIWQ